MENRDELDRIIGAFILGMSQSEALDLFGRKGVTVGPVRSMAERMTHPCVVEREVLVDLPDDDMGSFPMHNIVARMSGTLGVFKRPAPTLGEHDDEILEEISAWRGGRSR